MSRRPEIIEGHVPCVQYPLLQGGVLLLVEAKSLRDGLDVDRRLQGCSELLGEVTLDPAEYQHREHEEQHGDDEHDAEHEQIPLLPVTGERVRSVARRHRSRSEEHTSEL